MKYYAIRKGRKTGIFNSWTEASKLVTGFKGAEFKSFTCLQEAQEYSSLPSVTSCTTTTTTNEISKSGITKNEICKSVITKDSDKEEKKEKGNVLDIYTDGACRSNGKSNAVAGYGIFYGLNDSRNISRKLTGSIQTNNRAELMAVIEALKNLNPEIQANIYTDSLYVKKGLDSWMSNWKKSNWKTSTGKVVLNQDLWKLLDEIKRKRPFARIIHVKGHSGNLGNEMADELAVAGCFLKSA